MERSVVIGQFEPYERTLLERAAGRADRGLLFHLTGANARVDLECDSEASIQCFFVDEKLEDLDLFLAWVRGDARFFATPVVVVVSHASDHAYGRAHATGADDAIVRGDEAGVTRRLANLRGFDPRARPPIVRGRAVVAHPHKSRRTVLGRILRQAGFDVSFAGGIEEFQKLAQSSLRPALVVASQDLGDTDVIREIELLREHLGDVDVPVILLSAQDKMATLMGRAERFSHVMVSGELAPPDDLLFLANELLQEEVQNLRSSPRMLFGTICSFRPAGELDRVFGLTYNICGEGLFVRTLDPLKAGQSLWFELRPPAQAEAVHLRGHVVWSRNPASPGGAAPPGFAVSIEGDLCPPGDLSQYREAYWAVVDKLRIVEHQGPRLSEPSV